MLGALAAFLAEEDEACRGESKLTPEEDGAAGGIGIVVVSMPPLAIADLLDECVDCLDNFLVCSGWLVPAGGNKWPG
jgi:hypothetical protein